MRILTIADHETCLAFSLAGIATSPANSAAEASSALDRARQEPDTGLILITERLADSIRDQVDMTVYRLRKPLLVEIPDTRGPLPDRPSARDMMVSIMKIQ